MLQRIRRCEMSRSMSVSFATIIRQSAAGSVALQWRQSYVSHIIWLNDADADAADVDVSVDDDFSENGNAVSF